jgi:hypothetical protein
MRLGSGIGRATGCSKLLRARRIAVARGGWKKGQNMSSNSGYPEDLGDEEVGSRSRGSTHAVWSQRRQAKQRTRVRAKRSRSGTAAMNGMHLRRNKRSSW